ncbi:prolyl 4-hydroxylase 1 isoform X1 [Cinnamomum micranthum f. kanehirae]|uniref:Prolyl 4-hydroxylase 1 isoform X1 n=1 Tax=Cinnamomum micranthum f. kanehirae TaxID=337451 RepID=A0A3S3N2T4_9MAGN|nr:prolyl 4-hydroxylase 1 isoform X1 [Cinnamomum micranthum f. kanehirae]
MARTKLFFGLLTFITFGMIIGSLFQLAFIRKLEEKSGISHWSNDKDADSSRLGFVKPEIISWSPRIIVLHNFLSTEGVKSDVRTSSGMFLSSEERKYPIIQAIEKRIAVFSQIPEENGELIQFNLKRGGQRIATMLMYLSDNVEGGETYFPMAGEGECSCGGKTVKGMCVKPTQGDAVLFWSMGLDGASDPNSIHGGCEVLEGEKWSATKWMRQRTTN